MHNRVAGCQPPAQATPLLRFGLPSPPGVVGMVMAPGSASGKHPFHVVCKCGLGCCVCGGCRVGVGVWGCGPLVMLHVRALFVGGGGCVWVSGKWGFLERLQLMHDSPTTSRRKPVLLHVRTRGDQHKKRRKKMARQWPRRP